MISYTAKTNSEHITCYYESHQDYERGQDGTWVGPIKRACVVYDHHARRFIKDRYEGCEAMNAQLVAMRTSHRLNDEMWRMIHEHA